MRASTTSCEISMTDQRRTRKKKQQKPGTGKGEAARAEEADAIARSLAEVASEDDAERAMGRVLSLAIPSLGVTAAIVVGQTVGLAPAILVLAATALTGTIGFLWASLRTLTGEAPLPEGVQSHSLVTRAPAPERKRETLRALKDLEFEHSIGKIDDADYKELSSRYRATAKSIMREMDSGLAPRRKEAERLVAEYLARRDLGPAPEPEESDEEAEDDAVSIAPTAEPARLPCAKCGVSNEPDAAFCKKCGTPLAKAAEPAEEKPDATV
jgi:hypothetical protein